MNYPDTLNQMWENHLAQRAPDAPTVVSTFAGCGGSSLGYSAAGYRELLAVEWDEHAVSVFRRNFPHVTVHQGDITQLDPTVLDLAPGELDVLDGSPPCQGFSTTGLRQIDDPRNQLFRQFTRLITAWQPRVIVMENVSGMVKGKMRTLFTEILTTLKTTGPGYRVKVRLLDASYLGVPQKRQRLIFIGTRDDLNEEPTHPDPRNERVPIREAFRGLPDPGLHLPMVGRYAKLAPHIPAGEHAGKLLAAAGKKPSYFSLVRLSWDKPSRTLVKNDGYGKGTILHPTEDRYIGTRELARIGSFPDQFCWGDSTYPQITARIGNSVPPLMMHAVASTIRDRVLRPHAVTRETQ
jgi:DNA (cytosine-5)-methyltransferase 1